MSPESTVEAIQEQAAQTATSEIAVQIAAPVVAVETAVSHVSEQVAEHAAISEERHDEILEGNAWLENRTAQLGSQLTEVRESLLQLREAQATVQSTLNRLLEMEVTESAMLSRVSNPTIQEAPPVQTVEPEQAEAPNAEEGHQEAATQAAPEPPPQRKRKLKI